MRLAAQKRCGKQEGRRHIVDVLYAAGAVQKAVVELLPPVRRQPALLRKGLQLCQAPAQQDAVPCDGSQMDVSATERRSSTGGGGCGMQAW
jgi:hypothetical protein